jgi:hypothetical protein
MLARALKDQLDPHGYQDMYGLRCYRGLVLTGRLTCYGARAAAAHEDILLYAPVSSQPAADGPPMIKANYFSRRYGGVRIAWRSAAQNLPQWREIDAQIWTFIAAWNEAQASPGPRQAEHP